MPCLCLGKRRPNHHLFHWPNFSFSRSQHSINPRRIHSTFSLHAKHRPRRILKRRHTAPQNLRKAKKNSRSRKSTESELATSDEPIEAITDGDNGVAHGVDDSYQVQS